MDNKSLHAAIMVSNGVVFYFTDTCFDPERKIWVVKYHLGALWQHPDSIIHLIYVSVQHLLTVVGCVCFIHVLSMFYQCRNRTQPGTIVYGIQSY